ncbi:glucokinase [Danxiaibacter flavus]|uniref:Glucokinase n=1 Tax=Danxiaibacter flavus TaxID=3049108 RepID=A0ABV3ZGJ4_9BACT|nr:glucokinase [Chitinophagaceae bacterium DXS]
MLPLIFSDRLPKANATVVAADVGGTKVNIAVYQFADGSMKQLNAKQYHTQNYSSFTQIACEFLQEIGSNIKPHCLCAGVAGPVINNRADLVNISWVLTADEIAQGTGIKDVLLINDLEANAYGLACLDKDDICNIYKGNPGIKGNAAIVAPGTGLGEAGLYWDGTYFHPFATEGGHCDFSPRTGTDVEILDYLSKKFDVVSWERLVSGPGITSIYSFLKESGKYKEEQWLQEKFKYEDDSAAISEAAIAGTSEIAKQTMELFVKYLARECSNMVLKMKATGGIYLGGGIPPKIKTLLQSSAFVEHFLNCDRMQEMLEDVPVNIIMNDKAALMGAAFYCLSRVTEARAIAS